ncbi:MAG TPA: hypothetical protein VF921_07755 [Vicinamibacterales bacterium]
MPARARSRRRLLDGTRVYLSGPMDFVASRANEAKFGWRTRVGEFLARMGVTVFDPWNKPQVRGLHEYGREGIGTDDIKNAWTFARGATGARARAKVSGTFWETQHIDLRMVDTSDFVIAYCPTNIYSVGTPHEIIVAREQRKPVLFVSPPVRFGALDELRRRLDGDKAALDLLDTLAADVPIKDNPAGIPSLWYLPLVGGENFFDGFGFAAYRRRFGWPRVPLDDHEDEAPPKNPLLPFLDRVQAGRLPRRWDNRTKKFVRNDDWLLWKLPARRSAKP